MALDELTRCSTELGLRGLCFNAARQQFDPSDTRFHPLWERASELGLVCLFHTGMVGMGAGQPGGMGIKLKYANPLLLDDVAGGFPSFDDHFGAPRLALGGRATCDAAAQGQRLHGSVRRCPQYWPAEILQQLKLVQNKVLFGTDWPVLTPERWMDEFDAFDIKDEIRSKILIENARRVLTQGPP